MSKDSLYDEIEALEGEIHGMKQSFDLVDYERRKYEYHIAQLRRELGDKPPLKDEPAPPSGEKRPSLKPPMTWWRLAIRQMRKSPEIDEFAPGELYYISDIYDRTKLSRKDIERFEGLAKRCGVNIAGCKRRATELTVDA